MINPKRGIMGRRRKYTKEFKESAVELYHSSGKTAKEIAGDLGIDRSNLSYWVKESEEGKTNSLRVFPGQGNPRDEELYRLKKENTDLREANEILKKAMAFFVVKNPR
jgi:transposase-like protein